MGESNTVKESNPPSRQLPADETNGVPKMGYRKEKEKMPKSYQRNVRMTDEVKNYVEKIEGNGFNQKFENLVLYFMRNEKELKKRIKNLEDYEKQLNENIKGKREILNSLEQIERVVKQATSVKFPDIITASEKNVTQNNNPVSSPASENGLQKCEKCVYISDCDTSFMKSHDYGENCALYEEEPA